MIKKIIRRDLPETNSSSSHSVVISMDPSGILGRDEWDLNIDENGILHIPIFNSFGREFFCTNSVLGKLKYLSCAYIRAYYKDRAYFGKQVHKFTSVIKGILGIKGVVFEEAAEFYRDLKDGTIDEKETEYYEFPSIDHQSQDIIPEMIESEETIKNFLLNRSSWLYGGSDEVREDPKVYAATEILCPPIACISSELGGDIGRVDVEVTADFRELRTELEFFGNFEKNSETGEWQVISQNKFFSFPHLKFSEDIGRLIVEVDKSDKMPINIEFYKYDVFSI